VIATEIELKLAARAGDLPALQRALESKAARGGRAARLVSTYFDTPDRDLLARGLVLRVRERDGRFVQTVKSDRAENAGPLARGEWEERIAGPCPDPAAPETGRFLTSDVAERLVPLFRTEVARQLIDLSPQPGTEIEAAVDRGRIVAPGRDTGEPISEVELELKSGTSSALYDLALDLLAVAPLRLEPRSKAERGYRLAQRSRRLAAPHFEAPDLDPAMSGDAALQRIGIASLERVLRNEAAVRRRSMEGVHQMRVAVRRLRAVLSAFSRMLPPEQRRWATGELRWLADVLGPARNLDVFATTLLARAPPRLIEPARLRELSAAVARQRRAAYAAAIDAIRSPRYTGMMLRLLRWFDVCAWRADPSSEPLRQPIAIVAAQVLGRRLEVVRLRGEDFADQFPEQRHRLRIALKKLRYTGEALASLYRPDKVQPFVRRLKQLQDDLGDISDVQVAHYIVAALSGPDRASLVETGERLVSWHEEGLEEREAGLRSRLDRLLATEPFWAG
jgi:inorganic triphosphatase YgiF